MTKVDPKKRLEDLEAVFTALAHPARRQMLLVIHYWGGSMTAGEIAGRFGHAWPTTTRHLKVLTDAGLVCQQRIGRTRVYHLVRPRLQIVQDWVGLLESSQLPAASSSLDVARDEP